jgi:uncharacterized protein YggE
MRPYESSGLKYTVQSSPQPEFDMVRRLILLMLFVATASANAQTPQPPGPPGPPVVVASGVATVKRAPDQAFVTLSTESRAPKPTEAQRLNAQAMTQVQDAVKKAGIAADAVRTLSVNLREDVDWVNGKRTSRGYVVSNAIEVRVDKLEDLGGLLDAAVTAGATNVSGIRFDLKDRSAAEREAVRLAVADARGRADAAADGAGARVVKVLRIEETSDRNVPPPVPMMRMAEARVAAAPETPVVAGEIEIRAMVTLTAAIEGR